MDEERLVEDLKFKEMCKLQIFSTDVQDPVPPERYNLVVACNKYGYLYIGYNKGVKIMKTAELTRLNTTVDKSKETVTNYPYVALQLGCMPQHLALSADSLTLSVCYRKDAALTLAVYDVRTLIRSGTAALSTQVLGRGSDISVTDLCWNPQNATVLAACLSDGSLLLCDTSAGVKVVARMQKDKDAKAICWSPKGKQLVVGKGDGSLVQYDLQLNEKRRIQKPYTFDDRVTVVDVCWLSTYKFIAAYADTDGRLQPNVVTISAPKEGDPMFINFEDICMGDGERQGQYHLKYIDKWEILLAMQSNGAEMGLMGKHPGNPNQWELWNVTDNARLTLPLNAKNEDTYPLGMALDTTSELVPAGSRAAPIVITLSTEGKLCPFYMIYEAECQAITSPPEDLPPGERQPIDSGGGDAVVPSMSAVLSAPQPASSGSVSGGGNAPGQASVPGVAASSPAFSFAKPSSSITSSVPSGSTAAPASSSLGNFSFSTPVAASSTTGFSFTAKTTASLPFGQSPSSTGSGFSFAPKTTTPSLGQPQAPSPGGFSFASKTTPTLPSGQLPTATSSSEMSFAPKTTAPTLPFGQASNSSGSGFSFSSSNTLSFGGSTPQTTSSSGIFSSQSKTAFTPSGSQSQKVVTPGVTGQSQTAGALPATAGQSAFSLGSSSPFTFSAPKVPTDLPKPQTQAQPVSAFTQPATKPSGFSFTSATSSGPTGFNSAGQPVSQGIKTPVSQLPKFRASSEAAISTQAPSSVTQPLAVTITGNTQSFGSQPKPSTVNVIKPSAGVPSTKPLAAQPKPPAQPTALVATDPQGTKPSAGQVGDPHGTKPSAGQVGDTKQNATAAAIPPTQATPGPDKLQTAFSAKIQEEMELFSRELKALRQRAMAANYAIGTEDEKKQLRASIDKLTEFRQESVEVTKSVNEDIHHLKCDTLNAFSLVEEAKVREQRNNDPRYVYFLKARSLDPATLKKLREIRSKHHNLDVGLKDVNACLDAAWEEQHLSCGRKKRVMKPPTMDAVYQTLSNHHNIITNLREQLKVVKQRLREAQCYDISAWPSPKTPSASGLPDVEMHSVTKSMSKTRISDAMMHTPISAKKRSQLKDLLSQRSSTPIRSAKKSAGNLSQMIKFSNSYLVQDGEDVSARPLKLSKELEVADDITAGQPLPCTPPAKVEVESKQEVQAGGFLAPLKESVKDKEKLPPPPTSPVIKATPGMVTVEWGASTKSKLTPSQAAGVAAVNRLNSQQMAAAVLVSQTTPAQKDLPPVVNIGKLESMKESMPPPVTFAPVGSSVNAGTAKVLHDVIAEMAMASGKTTQQFTRSPKSPAAQLSPTTLPKSLENLAKPQPTSVVSVGPHPNISAPIASSAKAFTIQPDASAFSLTSPAGGQSSLGKTPVSQPLKPTTSAPLSGFSGFGKKNEITTSSSLPAASPTSSSQPSFGFNSVSSTGASSTVGFSFNSGFSFSGTSTPSSGAASAPQTGFSFGKSVTSGTATATSGSVASNQALATKYGSEANPVSQSSTTGFSFSNPSGGIFGSIAPTSATTPASVTPTTAGAPVGFSFGIGSVSSSSSAVATPTMTTSTVGTSLNFGATLPSSSSSTFGFSFNEPNPTGIVTAENSFTSLPKSKPVPSSTPAPSTSPSSEEPPKLALPSTGKTAAAVGTLDITTGGSAMPVSVKGQELHFPHQESSPSQVAEVKDQGQKSNARSSEASAKGEVTPTAKPVGGFSFGSTGALATTAAATTTTTTTTGSDKEPAPASSQSLLVTPASATATSSSNKNLMSLLTSDDEPAPASSQSLLVTLASATATSSSNKNLMSLLTSDDEPAASSAPSATTSFSFTPTSSGSSGFSFGKPTTTAAGFSFGQAAPSSTTSSTSGFSFGQAAAAAPTSTSSGSHFGQTSPAFGSTVFGNKTAGTDVAGTGAGSSFGSTTLFGKKPQEIKQVASTSGLMFGSNTGGTDDCGSGNPAPSGFSFSSGSGSSLPFGQSSASSSGFGQNPSFGSAQPSSGGGDVFGGSSGDGGGGMFSGLGGKPSAEAAKINPFGVTKPATTPPFGGPSLFGNQKDKMFGGTDEAGAFGTPGPFTSSTDGFTFGQTASASNAASGFGSAASFGASPSFGGTAFGSTSSFSSPIGSSTFGGGSSSGGGFSVFANNDTPGFGNLVNQGSANFASMGSNQSPAFGAGFGQQSQGSVFGGGSTFGAAASPFGSGGSGGGGQAFSNSSSPFGNNTADKSPSFSGWR